MAWQALAAVTVIRVTELCDQLLKDSTTCDNQQEIMKGVYGSNFGVGKGVYTSVLQKRIYPTEMKSCWTIDSATSPRESPDRVLIEFGYYRQAESNRGVKRWYWWQSSWKWPIFCIGIIQSGVKGSWHTMCLADWPNLSQYEHLEKRTV